MATQPLQKKHPQLIADLVDLEGFAQASRTFATSATSTGVLIEGVYDVWADQDVYLKVAETANDVTTSTGYLLRANNTITLLIRENRKLGVIMSSATGTAYYHQVG